MIDLQTWSDPFWWNLCTLCPASPSPHVHRLSLFEGCLFPSLASTVAKMAGLCWPFICLCQFPSLGSSLVLWSSDLFSDLQQSFPKCGVGVGNASRIQQKWTASYTARSSGPSSDDLQRTQETCSVWGRGGFGVLDHLLFFSFNKVLFNKEQAQSFPSTGGWHKLNNTTFSLHLFSHLLSL